MKTKLIIILFTSLLGCDQCDHDPPLTELEKLPPTTQEGKNTFGCLVNGKAWVTKTSIDAAAFYQGGLLHIGANRDIPAETIRISLTERSLSIKEGDTYSLSDSNIGEAEFYSRITNLQCDYTYDHTISGRVTITRFDKVNLIVSGSFEFETALSGCDTVSVSQGRFDLTYAN